MLYNPAIFTSNRNTDAGNFSTSTTISIESFYVTYEWEKMNGFLLVRANWKRFPYTGHHEDNRCNGWLEGQDVLFRARSLNGWEQRELNVGLFPKRNRTFHPWYEINTSKHTKKVFCTIHLPWTEPTCFVLKLMLLKWCSYVICSEPYFLKTEHFYSIFTTKYRRTYTSSVHLYALKWVFWKLIERMESFI